MRHNFHLDGFKLRLRPVQMEDAAFITWLRNLDYVKGNVGDSAQNVVAQENWLKSYFDRPGDYYFIVETLNGIPLGTHGVYDVKAGSAEKGRHIMRPEVLAGLPNSMLLIDLAFKQLELSELRSNHVSTNQKLYSLHRKCGFKQIGIKHNAQIVGGSPVDLIQYILTKGDWSKVRGGLLPLAEFAGCQVSDWDKTQSVRCQPWEAADN